MKQRIPIVLSAIALAVAIFGSTPLGRAGYSAVTSVPNKSVGTAQLKNNAVTSAKVMDGSLLKADFKTGQLGGTFGSVTVQYTQSADIRDGTSIATDAYCLDGQRAIAGGVRGDDINTDATEVSSSRVGM